MKINIRESATLLAVIAMLATLQAGPAAAKGGASDLRYERAYVLPSRSADTAHPQKDRQKAAIKDQVTSDADPASWFGLEWPHVEQRRHRPFPRHHVPHGR